MSTLRKEIQDVVKLYEYTFLEKLVHLVVKVELPISTKHALRKVLIIMAIADDINYPVV